MNKQLKQLTDGQPISVDNLENTTIKMRCCDCGLVHDMQFHKKNGCTDIVFFKDKEQTLIERGWKYYSQDSNTACFPIAVLNAGIFIKKQLDYNKIVKSANCENGNCVDELSVIKKSKLPLIKTEDISDVFTNGGILTIMHPIFNLHACFIEPTKNDNIKVVNSWLGSNEIIISTEEIKRFIPKHKVNQKMYFVKK